MSSYRVEMRFVQNCFTISTLNSAAARKGVRLTDTIVKAKS